MGVIKRQSIKKSIVSYIGVGIGAISTLFIFPLEPEALGLVRFLVATAVLCYPFASLGTNIMTLRFFPEFKDAEKKHHNFLGLLYGLIVVGFSLFVALAYLFKEAIYGFYQDEDPLILAYLTYVIPFTLITAFTYVTTTYISNFQRVVVPHIINDLVIKLALPTFILLFSNQLLTHISLVHSVLGVYTVNLLLLMVYLYWLGEFRLSKNFSFLTRTRIKRMSEYTLFGMLGSFGSLLAFQIDTFMVGSMIGMRPTGVYTMAMFFSNTIQIPMRSVISIVSPIVSQAAQENNYAEIEKLYKKTSITLFISGAFLYGLIVLNLDNLLDLLPKGDVIREGKYVILLLGAAKLIDLATSINGYIINYSKYFRFSLYAILILGVLNIILNLIFIPRFQITGVAMASLISLTLYNIIKVIYVYIRFKMQPFTIHTLKTLLLVSFSFILAWILPSVGHAFWDIVVKSMVFTLCFGSGVLYFNPSPDITETALQLWKRIQKLLDRV